MAYTDPTGKTVCELEHELAVVWREHYQPGPEYGDHISFTAMVELFANDEFYKLHLVAKEYLTLDPVFRVEIPA